MGEESKFYDDLDQNKRSSGSCNCLTLAILIITILFLGELLLFFVGRGIRFNSSGGATGGRIESGDLNFSQIESGDKVEIVISEGTLCSKLAKARQQNNLNCRISPNGVLISGKLATFLPANSSILIVPQADGGKLKYETSYLKVGRFKVAGLLAPTIGRAIEQVIGDLDRLKIIRVDLDDSIMIVVGKKTTNN